MLTNNYKTLLSFDKSGTFKDVTNTEVEIKAFLGGQGGTSTTPSSSSGANTQNNHEWRASTSRFNYDPTTATNSYTDEQTAYKWLGVVNKNGASGNTVYVPLIYNGFVIFVGTGDTAAAATDIKLATPVTLDVTAASCTHNANGKTYVQRTFQNNTGADVTVKEVGCYVFKSVASCTESYVPTSNVVMIGRTVLETPVTIANGDSETFTYVINNVIE